MKKKVKYFTLLLVFFIGISLIYSNNVYAGNLKIKDLELVSALAVGYPNQSPKKRPREPLESIII